MGKLPYLLPHQPALMSSPVTAARLRTTVARAANLILATAPEPRSASAGTCDNTDIFSVAVDFISEDGKSMSVYRLAGQLRFSITQSTMIHDVYDQDRAIRLQFSKNPKRRAPEMYVRP